MIEYLIRECPDHGVTVTSDANTARIAREVATWCVYEMTHGPAAHVRLHALEGHDCYVCCDRMRVANDGEHAPPA